MKLPKILHIISKVLQTCNAKAIVVGGSVRDHFLEIPIKDYDIEVYGLKNMEQLKEVLEVYGSVNLVGKSFGVLKFIYDGEEYDFSFPRKESKTGEGHRGFEVEIDGSLDFKSAARRRDFTLNALGYEIETKMFIDPFGGLNDIKAKIIRHIDENTFVEDPLRVYRAVQFSARFGFKIADMTKKLCIKMVNNGMLEELPKERIYNEWKKLLLKSTQPSIGFNYMKEFSILKCYFPELNAIIGISQPYKWHPEGDVWIHTMMSLDVMCKLLTSKDEKYRLKMLFAILCHDFGKASTTTVDEKGVIRAIGHENAGVEPTKTFLGRLTEEHDLISSVLPLVEHHLKPSQFYLSGAKSAAIRRLATKVNIEDLVIVAKADFLGRTTKESLLGVYDAGDWLLKKAEMLQVKDKPLENFIQGKDLIALGLQPSVKFKTILNKVYELQLNGVISTKEKALEYVKKYYTT